MSQNFLMSGLAPSLIKLSMAPPMASPMAIKLSAVLLKKSSWKTLSTSANPSLACTSQSSSLSPPDPGPKFDAIISPKPSKRFPKRAPNLAASSPDLLKKVSNSPVACLVFRKLEKVLVLDSKNLTNFLVRGSAATSIDRRLSKRFPKILPNVGMISAISPKASLKSLRLSPLRNTSTNSFTALPAPLPMSKNRCSRMPSSGESISLCSCCCSIGRNPDAAASLRSLNLSWMLINHRAKTFCEGVRSANGSLPPAFGSSLRPSFRSS